MAARHAEPDDYYRILGVARDVGEDGLKRAYKRQALRWHPDKNQHRSAQAAERFKKVSEAYQALSNKRSRAVYNQKRPSAGNNEVLFSQTYGWPGVNISFYWTGAPPKKSDDQQPAPKAQQQSKDAPDARNRPEDGTQGTTKSPLELFRDMFEIESPLAAIDRKLDGLRRQGSIFESVFGSFKSFESTQETAVDPSRQEGLLGPAVDPATEDPNRPVILRQRDQGSQSQANSTTTMNEVEKRIAFIEEEYRKGDLNEAEYKELIGLFSARTDMEA